MICGPGHGTAQSDTTDAESATSTTATDDAGDTCTGGSALFCWKIVPLSQANNSSRRVTGLDVDAADLVYLPAAGRTRGSIRIHDDSRIEPLMAAFAYANTTGVGDEDGIGKKQQMLKLPTDMLTYDYY